MDKPRLDKRELKTQAYVSKDGIDAMYVEFSDEDVYETIEQIKDTLLVDYSKDGKIVGVEIIAIIKMRPKNVDS